MNFFHEVLLLTVFVQLRAPKELRFAREERLISALDHSLVSSVSR
jgi:hypothetical protein